MSTNTEAVQTARLCCCGCGMAVAAHRNYLQGHDARHASIVAAKTAAHVLANGTSLNREEFYQELPTNALVAKARNQAGRLVAKKTKSEVKVGRAPKHMAPETTETLTGTVKQGRWEYPARMTQAGKIQRNSNRDGSGAWLDTDSKFTASA